MHLSIELRSQGCKPSQYMVWPPVMPCKMWCSSWFIIVWLVVSNIFLFHNIWDNHPNWLIFFRGVGIPPTSSVAAGFQAERIHFEGPSVWSLKTTHPSEGCVSSDVGLQQSWQWKITKTWAFKWESSITLWLFNIAMVFRCGLPWFTYKKWWLT